LPKAKYLNNNEEKKAYEITGEALNQALSSNICSIS
jgi:hypothetical protein